MKHHYLCPNTLASLTPCSCREDNEKNPEPKGEGLKGIVILQNGVTISLINDRPSHEIKGAKLLPSHETGRDE